MKRMICDHAAACTAKPGADCKAVKPHPRHRDCLGGYHCSYVNAIVRCVPVRKFKRVDSRGDGPKRGLKPLSGWREVSP